MKSENTGDGPDYFLTGVLNERMPDRGPRYKETPTNPFASDSPPIAEPYNTATAFLFVVLVIVWVVRLYGRYRHFPFVVGSLPILAVGAVGGTLYHATRTRSLYFFLDVIPISLLGLGAALYLTFFIGRRTHWLRTMMGMIGLVVMYMFVNGVLFRFIRSDYPTLTVNLSYASLAIVVLIPMVVVLAITRARFLTWMLAGLGSFAIAWFCRLVDPFTSLPMGSHWLWHTFGVLSTAFLYEYFYNLERYAVLPRD